MTENHDLSTPAEGSSDWHIPLNDNFRAIDTGLEIRDVGSNRGSYVPKAGAKFFETDTETLYMGDGSNWKRVRSSGRSPSFRSAALNGEVMHAWPQTDFQVGDGDSIQDAIDRISNSTDSAVIDITEAYDESVESRPIVVDHAVTFVGHGAGKNARIEFPTDGTPIFEVNTNLNPRYRVGFSNLWIKGGSIAIDVVDAENLWTSKCYLSDQRDHGIDYTGSEFSGWSVHFDTIVHDCRNGPAWELRDAETAPNNTTMIECQARSSGDGTSSTGVGVALGGFGVTWRGGGIERNDDVGLIFDDGSGGNYLVEGVYFESNGKQQSGGDRDTDILVDGTGVRDVVLRCNFHTKGGMPATNRYVVNSAQNVRIVDPRGPDEKDFNGDSPSVRINGGAKECKLEYDMSQIRTSISSSATRIVQNGQGENPGDPRKTGEWNGYGYPGLRVRDTVNSNWYEFWNGDWVPA